MARIRANNASGGGGSAINPTYISGSDAGFNNHTFNDLVVGKKYLVLFSQISSGLSYNRCDITAVTTGDADYTLIGHFWNHNSGASLQQVGSYYLFIPKTTSVKVTHNGTCGYDLIQLD